MADLFEGPQHAGLSLSLVTVCYIPRPHQLDVPLKKFKLFHPKSAPPLDLLIKSSLLLLRLKMESYILFSPLFLHPLLVIYHIRSIFFVVVFQPFFFSISNLMESTLDFCPVHMGTFAIAPTLAPRILSSVNMELPDASSYNPASTVQNDGRSAKKKKKNTCEFAPFTWWCPIKIFFEDFST